MAFISAARAPALIAAYKRLMISKNYWCSASTVGIPRSNSDFQTKNLLAAMWGAPLRQRDHKMLHE